MSIVGRLKPGASYRRRAGGVHHVLAKQLESQHPERNPVSPRLVPLRRARERASASSSRGADVRRGSGDVDCLRESFASANGANGDATKGNGDTSGVRSWTFSAAATGAHRKRDPLVLRRRAGPASRRGGHARAGASEYIQPSSSRKRSSRSDARWCSPCWRRWLRACSLVWRPRYRFRRASFVKGCKTRAAARNSSAHGWFRDGLVVSEFALACVLLVGAALLIQSFRARPGRESRIST